MKIILFFQFALFLFSLIAGDMDARAILRSSVFSRAVGWGADVAVRLAVADEKGQAVSNAAVEAYFDMTTYQNKLFDNTDANGICLLKSRTRGNSIQLFVSREGYYESKTKMSLASMEHPHAVTNGVWQPSPLPISLVLKKRHVAIPSVSFGGCYYLPMTNHWFAFDLEAHDWLEPNGKGRVPDVEFCFTWFGEGPMEWTRRDIAIRFPGNPFNGGYLVEAQKESEFPYSYAADPNRRYTSEFRDGCTRASRKFGMLDRSQDFVFRCRCVTNEVGELVSARYGRFRRVDYGHERTGQGVLVLRYDYNPAPNDTNLEFIWNDR